VFVTNSPRRRNNTHDSGSAAQLAFLRRIPLKIAARSRALRSMPPKGPLMVYDSKYLTNPLAVTH
jgi:hypothetical protein